MALAPRTRTLVYVSLVAASATVAAVRVATDGLGDPWALAVFAALGLAAEHTAVVLPSGFGVSPTLMLVLAAVYVSGSDGHYLAGALAAAGFGVFLPHLRARHFDRVAFNVSQFFLSGLAAAAVIGALHPALGGSLGAFVVAAVPASLVFSTVNIGLLVPVVAMSTGSPPRALLRELAPVYVQSVPFALVGGGLGWLYQELGLMVAPLLVATVLIARHGFGSYLDLRTAYEATLRTFVQALEDKDRYTAGHVERVAVYADAIGRELRLPIRQRERLHYAALLHDVGKLVVPNHLLNKPGRLTEDEFAVVRRHEDVTLRILEQIDFLRPAAAGASGDFNHFSVDGDGPLEGYIVAVADAYDAMTSTRSYRQALSQEVAFEELRRCSGTQFHPACVDALIRYLERRGERHGAGCEEQLTDFIVPPPVAGTGSAGLGDLAPSPPLAAAGHTGAA